MAVFIHILDKTGDEVTDLGTIIDQVVIIQDKNEVLSDVVDEIVDQYARDIIQIQGALGGFKRRDRSLAEPGELDG